jgi:hypothetical protein
MPKTNVEMGVKKFVRWYKNYFKTIKWTNLKYQLLV